MHMLLFSKSLMKTSLQYSFDLQKMANKTKILSLYKDLLRESAKFKSYYFRNYFTRKTKTQFRKHINADDEASLQLMKKSEELLATLRRQTVISNLYDDSRLVIEDRNSQETNKS